MNTYKSLPFVIRTSVIVYCVLTSLVGSAQSILWHYLGEIYSSGHQLGVLPDGNIFVVGEEPQDSLSIKIFSNEILMSNIGLPDYSWKYRFVGLDPQSGRLLFLYDHKQLFGLNPYSGNSLLIFDFRTLDTISLRINHLYTTNNELYFKVNPLTIAGQLPYDPYFLIMDRSNYHHRKHRIKDKKEFSFSDIFSNGDWLFIKFNSSLNRLELLKIDSLDNEVNRGFLNLSFSRENLYGVKVDSKDQILMWGDTSYYPNRLHRAFLKIFDKNFSHVKSLFIGPNSVKVSTRILYRPLSVIEANEGGYLITGDKAEFIDLGNYQAWFYRISNDFEKKWEFLFAPALNTCSASNAIHQGNDQWLTIGGCGSNESFFFREDKMLLLHLDGSATNTFNHTDKDLFLQPTCISDVLYLNRNLNFKSKFSILDLNGRRILDGDWSGEIRVSELLPGIYQLILHREGIPLLFRFVKN